MLRLARPAWPANTSAFLVRIAVGVEADRRLHRHHRQQLEHMVRHHVAQRAGLLVELAAPLDADRLGHGDLHVVDAVAIPDRLEQPVGEAERHDVLHRLLAEEMVDAENLVLVQRLQDAARSARGAESEAVAERLLDHHAAPELGLAVLSSLLLGEPALAKLLHHGAEEPVRDREIEDDVALRAVVRSACVERTAKLLVELAASSMSPWM